jgi:opacity protein-like surface antigen
MAQWRIAGSYQIRNAAPKKGFGVRVERNILQPLPIVDLGLFAHFSYFKKDNYSTAGDLTVYDYGLAARGGVTLGLVKPYVGIGIGNSNADLTDDDNGSTNKLFWNGFIGAELTPIPILNPFIEYRFQPVHEAAFVPNSDGRLVLGVYISF